MPAIHPGSAIDRAREAAGFSQRGLADATGIPQSTLSRIITGDRMPKAPELVCIAEATGITVGQLCGSAASDRIECAARSTNGAEMGAMRQRVMSYVELDAYLDDHAIA